MTKGIVLVSHVAEIGEGIERLLKEVAKDVPITVAAGLEDREVGTSFEKIMTAFENNSAEEILAFYDLGSAKMNLEMVMDMSDKTVHLMDTAIVESAYTAAALLQVDADLDTIMAQLQEMKIK